MIEHTTTSVDAPPAADDEREDFHPTYQEAALLISDALNAQIDEPEALVKLLLILSDKVHDPGLSEAMREMMKAAFDHSLVHWIAFNEYLEAIRQGRNPLQEARARQSPQPDEDLNGARPNQSPTAEEVNNG